MQKILTVNYKMKSGDFLLHFFKILEYLQLHINIYYNVHEIVYL